MNMLPESQKEAFSEFYRAANHTDLLDRKTATMIAIAAAMSVGCYPCMEHYFESAKEVGLTRDEIGAVQAIVMAVSAGKVKAQVQEVLERDM